MRTTFIALALCLLVAGSMLSGQATKVQFKITYPTPNSSVSGETIELKGVGADPAGQLKVEVLTNKWWLQDQGTSRIESDGSWSYGPCYLSGQGNHNNHTIR